MSAVTNVLSAMLASVRAGMLPPDLNAWERFPVRQRQPLTPRQRHVRRRARLQQKASRQRNRG